MKSKKAKQEQSDFTLPQPEIIEASQFKHLYFGPDVPTLELECWEEELSEAQLAAYSKADEEYKSIQAKLDDIVKETKGEVVYNGDQFCAYQLLGKQPSLKDLESKSVEIIRSRSRSISKEPAVTPRAKRKARRDRDESYSPEPETKKKKHKKEKDKKEKEKEKENKEPEKKEKTLAPSNVHSVMSLARPSESTAVGGLTTGTTAKTPVVDLTKEDSGKNVADSKEISFNKLQGKTFPSLVVVARPWLKIRDTTNASDRATLDSKVKNVLMHTPAKFAEWLIQQGLLKTEQHCDLHPANKLKLGMYSDVTKFPYSGGYVWISECCPARFISVFNGSIFECAPHPPSVLLKLLYHWACQTNVQNVVQWVKVDNLYVKGFFTHLRAICTSAVEEHLSRMGGNHKKVEVGVISLGTTSHDGTQRQVKVEVLGILEQETKMVRLRAIEPLSESEKNYKKRFQKILEPLGVWVDKKSTILTDLTVDKGTLQGMGFKNIHQSSTNDAAAKNSNANIMEYLRRIVPRMFQNTLSLLSRQIIQQFLDELVWRERFGVTPGQAFDNIVLHVSEQTKIETKDSITQRLTKIATNPFKTWNYASYKKKSALDVEVEVPPAAPAPTHTPGKRGRKKKIRSPTPPPPPPPPTMTGRKGRRTTRVDYSAIEGADDDDDVVLASRKIKKEKEKDKPFEIKLKEKPKEKKEKLKDKKQEKVEKQVKTVKQEKQTKAKLKEKASKKRKREKALFDDLEDIPLKNIKKEIKQEEMVSLEKYYFGQTQEPDRLPPMTIRVKCTSCPEELTESTELLRHLIGHAVSATSGAVCACCLLALPSDADLATHVDSAHPALLNSDKEFYCLICEIRYTNLSQLSLHMSKLHQPLELPYRCGVCDYRSSSKRVIVQHFYQAHNRHNSLQCPHCLLVITAYEDGCDLQANVLFFLNHLKEHKYQCRRCALKFTHIGALREHLVRGHAGFLSSSSQILPLCGNDHLIPKPKVKARGPNKDWGGYEVLSSLENTELCVPDAMICKECGVQFDDENHFLGVCRCKNCGKTSSCWRCLLSHICPPVSAKQSLPTRAHCICGFSSDDGPSTLAHLLRCNRTSAYSSIDDATANTKQPITEPSKAISEDTASLNDTAEDDAADANNSAGYGEGESVTVPTAESGDNELSVAEQSIAEDAQSSVEPAPADAEMEQANEGVGEDTGSADAASIESGTNEGFPTNDDSAAGSLDYGPPPSVLNTTLTLDDLAPPSVLQQDANDPELLKNEQYEQPLATPRRVELEPGTLQSYMGDFDSNLPSTPQDPDYY